MKHIFVMTKLNLLTTISAIVVATTTKLIFKRKIIIVDFVSSVNNEANYKICKLKQIFKRIKFFELTTVVAIN